MKKKYDFCGWATRNDVLCSDGRTIRQNAFLENDGKTVPLVWQHQHDDPTNVLGHALLENRPEGVFCYGYFNDSSMGQHAKTLIDHGDINALSIYANKLKQNGGNVLHGSIKEVSLVLAGANPGASIIAHSDDDGNEDSLEIYTDEEIMMPDNDAMLEHEDKMDEEEKSEGGKSMSKNNTGNDKTIKDIIDTMTQEQKDVMAFIIGKALEDAGVDADDDEEGDEVKHNIFDTTTENDEILSHSDMASIIKKAKEPSVGTFQTALQLFANENDIELRHDAVSSGFYQTGTPANVSMLFPEYADVTPGAPELITNDFGWVDIVLNKVHKSPISRIRTSYVDIRDIDGLRAKGYSKGKNKAQTGNFSLVRRTTDPQTIYVKSALHRDDIVDITDFDYVQYLYDIDRKNLNEELAVAIMIGDSRSDESDDKIRAEHIRPIWTDDELYTIHADIDMPTMRESLQGTETDGYFGDNYIYTEAIIEKLLHTRERYKGSGTPDFYLTPHMLNVMLLARDRNGRRIFTSKAELASSLNVGNIHTVEQFADKVRVDASNNSHKLLGICVNLADYSLGSTKGGEVTHFTDFDIDFNQQKSLLETRCSGALTKVYSAIVIEEPLTQ